MTFKNFIFNHLSSKGQELSIAKFISHFSNDKDFPDTGDIREVSEYLYPKLDQESTSAFQKLLMVWQMQSGGVPSPSFLDDINHIIYLQTNDADYKYWNQIPAHINHQD